MRLIIFLLFFGSVAGQAFGQCTCTGQSPDPPLQGGDGNPLVWHSLKRLYMPETNNSPAWYCFERSVDNKSDRNVTDVFWKVAGFEKDVIPKQEPRCDVTPLEGEDKSHPQGPLYYNVGAQHYDTSVYSPLAGFPGAGKISAPKSTPLLGSVIEIADRGSGKTRKILFRASVKPSKDENEFEYEVTGSGTDKLLVYWYVPLTDDFKSMRMNRNSPVTAVPGETARYSARSKDAIGWTPAAVQIFDYDGHWLATGIASVYCSTKGKPEDIREQPELSRAPQ